MDEKELTAIVSKACANVLDARRSIEEVRHRKHHDFIDLLLEREKRRQDRIETVKAHVYGWGIITGLGGIGAALWYWLENIHKQ